MSGQALQKRIQLLESVVKEARREWEADRAGVDLGAALEKLDQFDKGEGDGTD